jgi:hypothetical protein
MKLILFLTFISIFIHSFAQNAIQLDGTNDVITVNYPGILGSNPRTIEAWIKTSSNYNPNTGGVQGVISDWGTFTTSNRSTFNVLFNNAIRFEVNGNGLNGTIPVNDGNWHHVAMVYDPLASMQVSLYVDGVLDVAGNLTIPVNTLSSYVRIGQRVDGLHFFNGKIDEYRLWSVALTQAQIIANKDKELCHVNDPNLKLYYTFNQGLASGVNTSETTVHDWSPNQKDGTLTNFTLFGANSNWVTGANLSAGFITVTASVTSCGAFTWSQTGQTYNSTGLYYDTLVAFNGCDSILKLNLTVIPISNQVSHEFSCTAYTWSQTGFTYNDSGLYSDTLLSISGCDSIITLMLTIFPQTTSDLNITSCDSYFWPTTNVNYTSSGNYSVTLPSTYGCDSTVTLHLNLTQSDTTNQLLASCFPISWTEAGLVLDQSGIFTHTFSNVNGCDSVVNIDFTLSALASNVLLDETTGTLSITPLGAMYTLVSCENNNALSTSNSPSFSLSSNGVYAVVLSQNGCVDTSDCVTFSSANLTNQNEDLLIFSPNPCQEVLCIKNLNQRKVGIRILDVKGSIVTFHTIDSDKNEMLISTGDLNPGLYFLQVDSKVWKFMKE